MFSVSWSENSYFLDSKKIGAYMVLFILTFVYILVVNKLNALKGPFSTKSFLFFCPCMEVNLIKYKLYRHVLVVSEFHKTQLIFLLFRST